MAESAPLCGAECERPLPYGHACEALCHERACPPCSHHTEARCFCGREQLQGACHLVASDPRLRLRLAPSAAGGGGGGGGGVAAAAASPLLQAAASLGAALQLDVRLCQLALQRFTAPAVAGGGVAGGGGGLEADRAAEWLMLGGPGVAALLRRAEQLPLPGSVAAPTAGPKPPPPPPSSPKGLSDPAGAFSCGAVCGGLLKCGHHACTETCHPLAADAARPEADAGAEAVRRRWYGDACPLLPSPQLRCPCGARAADEFVAQRPPRSACTDPLPTCGGPCGKQLRCGAHAC